MISDFLDALIPPDISLQRYNDDYLQQHAGSAAAVLSHAQATLIVDPTGKERAQTALIQLARPELDTTIEVRFSWMESVCNKLTW